MLDVVTGTSLATYSLDEKSFLISFLLLLYLCSFELGPVFGVPSIF